MPKTKPTAEQTAYQTYEAYCRLVDAQPLELEIWRHHHQRLFGTSQDRVIASAPVRGTHLRFANTQ
jgi:hypothetical protein